MRPYIDELTYTPASQYMRGDLSHNAFRAEVVAARDMHFERLAETMPVNSTADEQLWQLNVVEELWRETLEKVEDLAPKRMRLDLKILNGHVRELRDLVPQHVDDSTGDADTADETMLDHLEDVAEAADEAGLSNARSMMLLTANAIFARVVPFDSSYE